MAVMGCLLGVALAAQNVAAAETGLIDPVTDDDLLNPSPDEWLMFRGNYANWGYSELDQINVENVHQLELAWSFSLTEGPIESTPLVRNDVMFVPGPADVLHAIDARTGESIWTYRREWPDDFTGGGQGILSAKVNRSVALYGDSLYATTGDARLLRINASTGRIIWDVSTDNYNQTTHTTGPIVVGGKVISGRNCGPALVGGCYVMAHDAEDGRELWRFYLIPRAGEAGYETWGDLPYEKRRHVGAWHTGSYDPETDLVYWGTSVPAPAAEIIRGTRGQPMLYSNSTLALRPDTGELAWYFQHLPRDNWDLDHPFERILVDIPLEPDPQAATTINPSITFGEQRRVLTDIPGKNGIVWTLDRETGEFLWSRPTVSQNVISEIAPATGAVRLNEETIPSFHEDSYGLVCPSAAGGRNWPSAAYSPRTQAIYAPLTNTCMYPEIATLDPQPSDLYGLAFNVVTTPEARSFGTLHAVSVKTATTLWQHDDPVGMMSTLATAGDLVFAGTTNRRFRAHDARTGEVLWEKMLNAPVTGFPVSYAIDGEQYIAIAVGGGDLLSGLLNLFAGVQVPAGSPVLYVFRLAREDRPRVAIAPAPTTTVERFELPSPVDPSITCASVAAEDAERGAVLYRDQCTSCHGTGLNGGPNGVALTGPFFASRWQDRHSDDLVETTQQRMPPGGEGSLSRNDATALVAHVLRTAGVEARDTTDAGRLCIP